MGEQVSAMGDLRPRRWVLRDLDFSRSGRWSVDLGMPPTLGQIRSTARRTVVLACCVAGAVLALSAHAGHTQSPITQTPIIRGGEQVEKVFQGILHTEGAALGPDGRIYFCDLTTTALSGMEAGIIWAFDPHDSQTKLVRSPSGMATGIKFDAHGDMITAEGADYGTRAIVRTDRESGRSKIVAGQYQERALNSPNDLVIGANGSVYFTDPRYFGHEPIDQPVMGVYRIAPDGLLQLVSSEVRKPNGIVLSPNERTLYVTDLDNGSTDLVRQRHPVRMDSTEIIAFDVRPDGSLDSRRVFFKTGGIGVDGITVDVDGNVYATYQDPRAPRILVISATGAEIASIKVPEIPYNVALVATELGQQLYITAGRSLYRIPTEVAPLRPLWASRPAHDGN